VAPLSEILGREMETIGSGENRNAIKMIPSKITFLSQKRFPHESHCVIKATEETPLLLLFHKDLSL
jgi:hypothetical protein